MTNLSNIMTKRLFNFIVLHLKQERNLVLKKKLVFKSHLLVLDVNTVKSRFYESQFYESQFYELSQFYEVEPNDQIFTS